MAKHQNISGSEAILLSLIEEGVTDIFGYPGGQVIPIYDILYSYTNQLTHYLTRHEQGAVHAAQGYSRATGKVGVCLATSGPGATNFITGIADAMIDSTPLVCITGQVPNALLGSDAFQEADMISMTMPITKWNFQVTSASEMAEAIAKAFYIAKSGRPGPVVLDVTKTAQVEILEEFEYKKCNGLRTYNPKKEVESGIINHVAQLVDKAEKPLIIVGNGVKIAGGEKSVIEFSSKGNIPMASTLMGLSAIPSSNPLYIGMVGMHGSVAANKMTQECDLLIAVGMRFSDRVTGDLNRYAPNAKVIHIDIDAAELNKVVKAYIGINGDAKEVIEALTERISKKESPQWVSSITEHYKKEYDLVIKKTIYPEGATLKMGEAVRIISEQSDGNAIVVTDVGQQQMYAARYSHFNQSLSFITSGGLGTMGYGLPAAMGAKVALPERDVVAILGDGGFQMTMQELGTIAQNNIGVKIVILNNSYLGMVRQWQQLFFDRRYSFTELQNPDFAVVASAYGIPALKVNTRESLIEGVKAMFEHQGSFLLEVIVDREENVFPMVPAGCSISEQICNE